MGPDNFAITTNQAYSRQSDATHLRLTVDVATSAVWSQNLQKLNTANIPGMADNVGLRSRLPCPSIGPVLHLPERFLLLSRLYRTRIGDPVLKGGNSFSSRLVLNLLIFGHCIILFSLGPRSRL